MEGEKGQNGIKHENPERTCAKGLHLKENSANIKASKFTNIQFNLILYNNLISQKDCLILFHVGNRTEVEGRS